MTKSHLILICCCSYIMGMSFSPALLSMSTFALAATALISIDPPPGRRISWDVEAIRRLLRPWQEPALAVIGVLFLIVLLSGLQGGDMTYWLTRLRVKIPLLVLPLMFIMFPHIRERKLHAIYYFLILWMSVLSIGVGLHYLWHAEAINTLMKQGQPMPTPGNHIRFSMMLAYGVVCGAYLYWKKWYWKFHWERKLLLALSIFLFLFMHLLSVRSGLLVIYSCGLVMGGIYAFVSRRYWIAACIILGIVMTPLLAYYLIPSFKAKVEYMSYDSWMRRHEMGALYADSGRIVSVEVGYEIFRRHPVFGVGVGHIRNEVNRIFAEKHADLPHPLMPHNQF
ncbi:MAG: O-antigen ligase family protein, partial [Sinomicrobium sp.]|nr:O-antigen ligase family protein [Sinomicrobium sp.]